MIVLHQIDACSESLQALVTVPPENGSTVALICATNKIQGLDIFINLKFPMQWVKIC